MNLRKLKKGTKFLMICPQNWYYLKIDSDLNSSVHGRGYYIIVLKTNNIQTYKLNERAYIEINKIKALKPKIINNPSKSTLEKYIMLMNL